VVTTDAAGPRREQAGNDSAQTNSSSKRTSAMSTRLRPRVAAITVTCAALALLGIASDALVGHVGATGQTERHRIARAVRAAPAGGPA
jgi:hypothetical protein